MIETRCRMVKPLPLSFFFFGYTEKPPRTLQEKYCSRKIEWTSFFFETRLLSIDGILRDMLAIYNIFEHPHNVQVDAMLRGAVVDR